MGTEEPCAPRLPTAGLDFSASLEMTEGRYGGMTLGGMVGGHPVGRWRVTGGRFFASLKNDRDAGVKCGRRGAVRAADCQPRA